MFLNTNFSLWFIRAIIPQKLGWKPVQDTMIYSCFHCDRMATWLKMEAEV